MPVHADPKGAALAHGRSGSLAPPPPLLRELEAQALRLDVGRAGERVCWRAWGPADAPARPLLLLHGGHGDWRHWARNIGAWSADRRVWAADMPGYGDSDALPEGTLDALVARLQGSLVALPGVAGARVDLAGFSFGGLVAARLAAQRSPAMPGAGACAPDGSSVVDVDTLVLLGPAGHGGARRPRGELRDWKAAAQSSDAAALQAAMCHNLRMQMLHAAQAVDATALHIHTHACRATRFRSKAFSRADGLLSALAGTSARKALIWGTEDVTAEPERVAAAIEAHHPGCCTLLVPGAGHWVQYEAPDTVNPFVRKLLAGRATPAPDPASSTHRSLP